MNLNMQLIEKFAREAGYEPDDFGIAEWDFPHLKKFAELIVKECAKIAVNTDLDDVDGGDSAVLRAASDQIKKHFGV